VIEDVTNDTVNGVGITTTDVKVLICGVSSQTVIRSVGRKTTCGELKRQLGASRLMSCDQTLKDGHTFFDNDVVHVLGRLRGGMEVNFDQMIQLLDIFIFSLFAFVSLFVFSRLSVPLVPNPNPKARSDTI
jgi:hypothetical protein